MKDYFSFYGIPRDFKVDKRALKKKYHALSKEYHPDFHTDKSKEEQNRILELSSFNNEAFKVLSNVQLRMKYLLELKGAIEPEGQGKIPQDFLMEMMDVNEALMELEFDFDAEKFLATKKGIEEMELALNQGIEATLSNYSEEYSSAEELNEIKKYYFKCRYIWRIRQNLNKFAPA